MYDEYDSPPASSQKSRRGGGGSAINYIIVAVLFTIVGTLLSLLVMSGSGGVNEGELREIVEEMAVDEEELREIVSDLVIDQDELSMILQTVLQQANPAAVAQAVPSAVPIPTAAPVMDGADLTDDDPSFGPADAPIVIVEFSDFLCPFCSRHSLETMPQIRATYGDNVHYVFRDFHGIGGERSVQASIAAECAEDQGRFWDYHSLLFNNQSSVSSGDMAALRSLLIDYATTLGLDTETFTTCLDSRSYLSEVNDDHAAAQRAGVNGVPTFFINGTMFVGAQPYQNFADFIDAELRRLGISG